jgi:hypothetical protein
MQGALDGNQTLAAAKESLLSSQDALRAGYGVFLPQIDVSLSGTRQQLPPLRFGQGGPPSLFNLFTVSGAVSFRGRSVRCKPPDRGVARDLSDSHRESRERLHWRP